MKLLIVTNMWPGPAKPYFGVFVANRVDAYRKAGLEVSVAANRDPRMRQLYLQDLEGWKKAGGGMFAAFTSMSRYGKWGSWGLLENRDQTPMNAPKYQAVLEFMGRTPDPVTPFIHGAGEEERFDPFLFKPITRHGVRPLTLTQRLFALY